MFPPNNPLHNQCSLKRPLELMKPVRIRKHRHTLLWYTSKSICNKSLPVGNQFPFQYSNLFPIDLTMIIYCLDIAPPASSLYLQVFITFETYYSMFYLVFLFAIEFYKGKQDHSLTLSSIILTMLFFVYRLWRITVPTECMGSRDGFNLRVFLAAADEAWLGQTGKQKWARDRHQVLHDFFYLRLHVLLLLRPLHNVRADSGYRIRTNRFFLRVFRDLNFPARLHHVQQGRKALSTYWLLKCFEMTT